MTTLPTHSPHRSGFDRLWTLVVVLAVGLPVVCLAAAAATGSAAWLVPAAVVAAVVVAALSLAT